MSEDTRAVSSLCVETARRMWTTMGGNPRSWLTATYGRRREIVNSWMFSQVGQSVTVGERDWIRRVLDAALELPSSEANAYVGIYWSINPEEFGKQLREQAPKKAKESNMSTITITKQTLVNGKELKEYSDTELFKLIAQTEASIKSLQAIEHKPKRLQKQLEAQQQSLQALVELLDKADDEAQAV